MNKPITGVTIVGGGTAGWLSAFLISKASITDDRPVPKIHCTVIESPDIPTIGVGEATVPSMLQTLKDSGIDEGEFLRKCNATFKLGVLFDGWNIDTNGSPIQFVNPFSRAPELNGKPAAEYFRRFGGYGKSFTQTYSPCVDLAKNFKGPRMIGAPEYQSNVGFAYHLDASKFASMLKDLCLEMGVTHILDNVVEVRKDERGYVSELEMQKGPTHPVELVVDCSGFRGLIIREALDEPFVSYSKYLANDRALALQIPHKNSRKIEPLTRSTALSAGWSWNVPLFNRVGTGYVFSSSHLSDTEASDEFIAHLGLDDEKVEPKVIPMQIGRSRNAWVKNCVAIGLSGGFLEPLESTAIHMIDANIRWLIANFPDSSFPDILRDRFNKLSENLFKGVLDFIALHYVLNNRSDGQYWNDVRNELAVPDTLESNLELWKYRVPASYDFDVQSLFTHGVYHAVLMGKLGTDVEGFPKVRNDQPLNESFWQQFIHHSQTANQRIVLSAPDHRELLQALRGVISGSTDHVPVVPYNLFADSTAASKLKTESFLQKGNDEDLAEVETSNNSTLL